MTPSVTYENIIRNIRQEVAYVSGIDIDKVLNALSINGTDLSDILGSVIKEAYGVNDSFILFELLYDPNATNVVINSDNDDGTITTNAISNINFNLRVYGNSSYDVAQKLFSGFRIPSVATRLIEKGIHVKGATFPETHNEFINNTLWSRQDLTIKLEVRFENTVEDDVPFAAVVNKVSAEYKL